MHRVYNFCIKVCSFLPGWNLQRFVTVVLQFSLLYQAVSRTRDLYILLLWNYLASPNCVCMSAYCSQSLLFFLWVTKCLNLSFSLIKLVFKFFLLLQKSITMQIIIFWRLVCILNLQVLTVESVLISVWGLKKFLNVRTSVWAILILIVCSHRTNINKNEEMNHIQFRNYRGVHTFDSVLYTSQSQFAAHMLSVIKCTK